MICNMYKQIPQTSIPIRELSNTITHIGAYSLCILRYTHIYFIHSHSQALFAVRAISNQNIPCEKYQWNIKHYLITGASAFRLRFCHFRSNIKPPAEFQSDLHRGVIFMRCSAGQLDGMCGAWGTVLRARGALHGDVGVGASTLLIRVCAAAVTVSFHRWVTGRARPSKTGHTGRGHYWEESVSGKKGYEHGFLSYKIYYLLLFYG